MVASPGYNITCDPGDLYNRKCYTTNPTTGKKEEIIGYTDSGDPISKGESKSSWIAWVPSLTTLDLSGNAYQPYGEAGIPYTKTGSAIGAYMPSSGADMQDFYYLNEVMPGSQARKMYNQRECSPLWNVFGCKKSTDLNSETTDSNSGVTSENEILSSNNPFLWPTVTVAGIATLSYLFLKRRYLP
jgi:hypothetical protein